MDGLTVQDVLPEAAHVPVSKRLSSCMMVHCYGAFI